MCGDFENKLQAIIRIGRMLMTMILLAYLKLTVIMIVAITVLPLQIQEPGRASQQTSQPLQHQLSASETRTVKSVFNLTAI